MNTAELDFMGFGFDFIAFNLTLCKRRVILLILRSYTSIHLQGLRAESGS